MRVFHDGFVISSNSDIIMHNKQSEAIFEVSQHIPSELATKSTSKEPHKTLKDALKKTMLDSLTAYKSHSLWEKIIMMSRRLKSSESESNFSDELRQDNENKIDWVQNNST